MLRPGVLALEKTFDVAGDQLPLHGPALILTQVLCRRHAIATCFFGDVHTIVGDPNNVLRRKTMHGEAGYTEAAGNFVLA